MNNIERLDEYILATNEKKLFLVCGNYISYLWLDGYFKELPSRLGIEVVRFSDFKANPDYDAVVKGVEEFKKAGTGLIIAAGGGSAIDTAKCIKLFAYMDPDKSYLSQSFLDNDIKLYVIPTTAGTGSEVTCFAVIYDKGVKQSIEHSSILPDGFLLDASLIKTLPEIQKRATMLDALCHGIESFWSVRSTEESRKYSAEAIRMVLKHEKSYLANDEEGCKNMLLAANTAGRAINITRTTAAHAMSYKLTSLFGIPHGLASALCLIPLWRFMIENEDRCIDARGREHLHKVFGDIVASMGEKDAASAIAAVQRMTGEAGLVRPDNITEETISMLSVSVNPERLSNNPVALSVGDIEEMYRGILKED